MSTAGLRTCQTMCMVKIFRGGWGGDTFKAPPPANNFCLYSPPVLRCFWKYPTTPPQAPFTANPSPPPKTFDHTPDVVKIKGTQLKINLHSPIVHWVLIKSGRRTMMIRCILTQLLECKVHDKCLCQHCFWNFELQWLRKEASDHHGSLTICNQPSIHCRSLLAEF